METYHYLFNLITFIAFFIWLILLFVRYIGEYAITTFKRLRAVWRDE